MSIGFRLFKNVVILILIPLSPKFRSTLVKHSYKLLGNKKLLGIFPCRNFHLS